MEIIERVKKLLVSPKTEWQTISEENDPHGKVLMSYVLILALIPAIAAFIGYGLIGSSVFGFRIGGGIGFGLRQAIMQYLTMAGGVYVTAFVIDALATNFGAEKNFNKAFSLVAYSYTPMFVAGIFYILPSLSWLALIASLYSLYMLYIGLQPMMKAPAEKQTSYFIVSLLVMIVGWVIISQILSFIFLRLFLF